MAKAKENETTTNENAEAESGDGRYIMITDPATGEEVKRVDWIREVYQAEGGEFYGNRGAIAKKLTELQGKKVPYQIVFAATKDLKHVKSVAQAKAEEKAAAEAANADNADAA